MRICVVGWYFYPEFIDTLKRVNNNHPVTFVCHRDGDIPFDKVVIPNIGLEYGCYAYYLDNLWDGESSVFFTHDDIRIWDESVFDRIASIPMDFSMIFRDERECYLNMGYHGRAFFISASFLSFLKNTICGANGHTQLDQHKGFWFDKYNTGVNWSDRLSINKNINNGTRHMMDQIEWVKSREDNAFKIAPSYIQEYLYGFRGRVGLDGLFTELDNQIFATTQEAKSFRH